MLFQATAVDAQRCVSMLFYTESLCAMLLWLQVHVYWWICSICENNRRKQSMLRVMNGQSGERLCIALLRLGNFKTSVGIFGRLAGAAATIRFIPQLLCLLSSGLCSAHGWLSRWTESKPQGLVGIVCTGIIFIHSAVWLHTDESINKKMIHSKHCLDSCLIGG